MSQAPAGAGGEHDAQHAGAGDDVTALAEIQDGILDRLHAGEELDRTAVLAAHPRHAAALARFFELVEVIEARPAAQAATPTRLGEFEILRELGRGGMGVVYAARQPSLNRSVALKVLPPALRRDTRLHARFRREAEAAGRLRHPNIVPVYSIGESAGAPFFTMELVEGRSLAEVLRLRRAGESAGLPPPGDAWRRWCLQTMAKVGDALAAAHGAGILHRDVKPANILLEHDGTPRLTDFGLALDLQASELTQTGEVFGSPLYMSPEQAFRHEAPVDARTDVYSLAVTLYELLTLRLPYAGSTQADLLAALSHGRIVAPREADPELSEPAERVLLRALRRDPHERYGSAADFVADLRLLLENPAAVRAPRAPRLQRLALERDASNAALEDDEEAVLAIGVVLPRGAVRKALVASDQVFHPALILLVALAAVALALALGAGLLVSALIALGALALTALLRGALVYEAERSPRTEPQEPSWTARHPFLARLLLSLVLTAAVLTIVLVLVQRSEEAQRSIRVASLAAFDAEGGPSRAPSPALLQRMADGGPQDAHDDAGTAALRGWLRPEFQARSIVSRTEPSQAQFGFSGAELLPSAAAAAEASGLLLGWWPELEVNGRTWAGSAHGEVLRMPEEWSGGGFRYARFPLLDLLGDAAALDAVTVRPRIVFVVAGAETAPAPGVPPPAPPGLEGLRHDVPAAIPEGGTRWVWEGPFQTLFLYDRYPPEYPRAVDDAQIAAQMRAACTPARVQGCRAFGGSDHRQLQLTLVFEGGRERPVPGAFEAELLLPGTDTVGARATLVLEAAPTGSERDHSAIGLPFALTGPPSEAEQALLRALRGGPGATVRVVLRGSRAVALAEPGLDSFWEGTVDVELPVQAAADR